MRAELFINLQMISLGEKMQIDLTHDGAVSVGIVNDRSRIVPAGQVKAIIHLALGPGKNRLEKSLTTEPLGREPLLLFSGENDAYFLGVRTENADSEIIADPMWPKNPERIGMRPGEKSIELVQGQTGYFERAHARTAILADTAALETGEAGQVCHPEPRRRRGTSQPAKRFRVKVPVHG